MHSTTECDQGKTRLARTIKKRRMKEILGCQCPVQQWPRLMSNDPPDPLGQAVAITAQMPYSNLPDASEFFAYSGNILHYNTMLIKPFAKSSLFLYDC